MSGKAAKVVITERQQEVLLKFRNATTVAKRLSQRADIILLAFQGLDNDTLAQRLGLERHAVGRWRRRWQRAFDKLVLVACAESAAALRQAIAAVRADEPRPGCPATFTPEQLTLLLALACEDPALAGRPITHWTGHELAAEACQRGIVESISASQVNR